MKRIKIFFALTLSLITLNCVLAFKPANNFCITGEIIRVHCCLHAENWGEGPYGTDCISCTLLQFENPYDWATCPQEIE